MTEEIFNKMIVEFRELTVRTNACRDFILDENKFGTLDYINKDLLIAQLKAMETYLSILSIRLGINGTAQTPKESEETVADEHSEETTEVSE